MFSTKTWCFSNFLMQNERTTFSIWSAFGHQVPEKAKTACKNCGEILKTNRFRAQRYCKASGHYRLSCICADKEIACRRQARGSSRPRERQVCNEINGYPALWLRSHFGIGAICFILLLSQFDQRHTDGVTVNGFLQNVLRATFLQRVAEVGEKLCQIILVLFV